MRLGGFEAYSGGSGAARIKCQANEPEFRYAWRQKNLQLLICNRDHTAAAVGNFLLPLFIHKEVISYRLLRHARAALKLKERLRTRDTFSASSASSEDPNGCTCTLWTDQFLTI